MDEVTPKTIRWLQRPLPAVVITALLIVVIVAADFLTSERLDLSVMYFLPITLAAWALGRWAAFVIALLSDAYYLSDQLHFVANGSQSLAVSLVNGIVRLLVYLFVVEVTYRLVVSRTRARLGTQELARVNADLQSTYASLDEDVNAAGLLQSTVLEVEPFVVPGCEVGIGVKYAGSTGGDFIDAGVVDGRVFVCVADISGKGTPAALFTALLKHLLNEALNEGLRGGEVISAVNASLKQALPNDKFVTLFYAELDPCSGLLECVNAGHPDGLLYCGQSERLTPVEHTTLVLGSFDLPEVAPSITLQLHEGDALVVYSDGATDSKDLDGNRLGEEPIRRLALEHACRDAQEAAEAIMHGLQEMTQPGGRDDLAVACVKFTGNLV